MSSFLTVNAALAAATLRASDDSASPSQASYSPDALTADTSELIQIPISQNAAGTFTLIPGQAGKKIAVFALFLWVVAQNDLMLLNGGLALTGPLNAMPDQFALAWPIGPHAHFLLDDASDFQLTMSTAAQVSGYARYMLV